MTDPTAEDTDGDGISDGVEVNGSYGNPPQASDPRNNNTDGDQFDDGEEDTNFNGVVDANETDPTRIEDSGDFDGDGIKIGKKMPRVHYGMLLTQMGVASMMVPNFLLPMPPIHVHPPTNYISTSSHGFPLTFL